MLRAFIAGIACATAIRAARDARKQRRNTNVPNSDARDAAAMTSTTRTGSALYDSPRAVEEYLTFHYSVARDTVDAALRIFPYEDLVRDGVDVRAALRFVEACARVVVDALEERLAGETSAEATSALDVGCAVGGTSAALAKRGRFARVVGVDYSHAFIDAAKRAQMGEFDVERNGIDADAEALSRCEFERGDACALRKDIGTFDAVIAANVLCRLPDPETFLRACATLTKPGGVVVLASPYSWLEQWTPRERWLDFTAVRAILEPAFALERECDLPFIIREHARKFQLGVSHVAVFRRV